MCEERNALEAALWLMVHDLDPSCLRGSDAKLLVGFFSRLERLAVAGKALCALRVSETGVFEQAGHRQAGEWLAAESGESVGGAVSLLEAAENLSRLPEAQEAFRSGELSASQAKEVAGAGIMDPSATKELLDTARSEGFEDLRRRCNQVKAAKISKEDEDARTRRVHAREETSDLDRTRRHLPPGRQAHQPRRGEASGRAQDRGPQDLRRCAPLRCS